MKKIILYTLLFVFAFSACKKEETNTIDNNQLTYNGLTYELGGTATVYFLDDYVELFLHSSSITWNDNKDAFTGTGDFVQFEFYSTTSELPEGKFELNDVYSFIPLAYAGVNFNRNFDVQDTYKTFDIDEGEIEIKYNEIKDLYTIEFNLTSTDNEKLRGVFKGIVNVVDNKK